MQFSLPACSTRPLFSAMVLLGVIGTPDLGEAQFAPDVVIRSNSIDPIVGGEVETIWGYGTSPGGLLSVAVERAGLPETRLVIVGSTIAKGPGDSALLDGVDLGPILGAGHPPGSFRSLNDAGELLWTGTILTGDLGVTPELVLGVGDQALLITEEVYPEIDPGAESDEAASKKADEG